MNLDSRIAALRGRHAALEEKIRDEHSRPIPNTQTLSRLKLDKLYLKEEIDNLSR